MRKAIPVMHPYLLPYTSYTSRKHAKVGGFTKFFFAVFNFADGCVGLVPRRTESNFRGI